MARLLAVVLAGLLAAPHVHAADRSWRDGPNVYGEGTSDDGTRWRSRSWKDGPNVYTETQHSDGSKTRCRTYTVGPNTYETCN